MSLAQRKAAARRRLAPFRGLPERVEAMYADRAGAILAADAAGMNPTEIADALGVGRKIVYRVLDGRAGKAT